MRLRTEATRPADTANASVSIIGAGVSGMLDRNVRNVLVISSSC